MRKISVLLAPASIILFSSLPVLAGKAYVNQLGFTPDAAKQAVYVQATAGASLSLRNTATPTEVVVALTPSVAAVWAPSGEDASRLDFSAVNTPGTYAIYENDVAISAPFRIATNVYEDLLKASIKWFYYQRSSTELLAEHAGLWARASGHPDTSVTVHSTAGSGKISAPKGWYDAGDYGKYIVNSGITMGTLFDLYDHFPALFDTLTWNIPESGNGFPDLLDELRWNLDWMLKMQDPADGGVYHKLTTMKFSGSVMPALDKAGRYVVMKSTPATYDFSAVMARAARSFWRKDSTETAGRFYEVATSAFAWGEANRYKFFEQPTGMNTGTYSDGDDDDERAWAAVSLSMAVNTTTYSSLLANRKWMARTPSWGDVSLLATYDAMGYASLYGETGAAAARTAVLAAAQTLLTKSQSASYGIGLTNFNWGSNSIAANEGILLLHAYYISGDRAYLDAAQAYLDYLLGRNPLDMSYVTGFGTRSPKDPHHRPSEADGIAEPVPGMLVGGPHNGGQDVGAGKCAEYRVTNKPALSYVDKRCSYATNEVAINWNAPLAYLVGAIHALSNGVALPSGVQKVKPMGQSLVPGSQLIFDGSAVRLQSVQPDGSVRKYGLNGHRLD